MIAITESQHSKALLSQEEMEGDDVKSKMDELA